MFFKCEICSSAFFYSTEKSAEIQKYPLARVVNINNNIEEQQNFQHPNKRLFIFLKKIEISFSKHCKQRNFIEHVVNDITCNELQFPCANHADVYAYLISFYLQNRMRQYI